MDETNIPALSDEQRAKLLEEPKLQFFVTSHLAPHLRDVVRPFAELAVHVVLTLPRNPERTIALNHLVEAKDCAVRSVLWKPVADVAAVLGGLTLRAS